MVGKSHAVAHRLRHRPVTPASAEIDTTGLFLNDRHATISWGNPYFFSKNLYQSVSMYRDNFHAIRIVMQFAKKKSQHCVIKINS